MPINHPEQSTRSTTWSASSVDIPRSDELDWQKREDLRGPQVGYRICSSVTSAHQIEKRLNSAAMIL